MIALPKARSQGSNGAGGGALTAFTAISAAKAAPDTMGSAVASAVANKTSFFMTIPITFKEQPRSGSPQGRTITDCNQNSCGQSGTRTRWGEAKKRSICRLFRRYAALLECCWKVLHSHNKLGRLPCRLSDTGNRESHGCPPPQGWASP